MYDCRTRYFVCVPCILWCYNTKSVPLYVSSIHGFVMVHTGTAWYVLLYFVCTSTYWYIPVCTGIYWYILNTLLLYIWSQFQTVYEYVVFDIMVYIQKKLLRCTYTNFVASILYPTSKKKLRYRWSKWVGLEPPPNIVPDIEVFDFDIEVMTSI